MGATHALLTFEEFERLPESDLKQELINGELIEMPPAKRSHNLIAHRVYRDLDTALTEAHAHGQAQELGEVYHEMGYKLGGSWATPDVSITHAGQTIEDDVLIGAPAIAIEVVSPGNSATEMEDKMCLYFAHGAREVWHFYPKQQYVAVFTSPQTRVTVSDTLTTPLLPGCALSIAKLLDAK